VKPLRKQWEGETAGLPRNRDVDRNVPARSGLVFGIQNVSPFLPMSDLPPFGCASLSNFNHNGKIGREIATIDYIRPPPQ
jgi:hypothetical protein